MRWPVSSSASSWSGRPYHDANVIRRNSIVSAHSSSGDGSVLPHGVVIFTVIDQPSRLGIHSIAPIHLPNFSSHVRPLFAGHAMPAAGSLSSHCAVTFHTSVRDESTLVASPA